MFTSLLTSICHFASGFLSGFGLQSAAGAIASAGTGELVAAGLEYLFFLNILANSYPLL